MLPTDYDEELSPEMARKKWSPGYLYILDYGDGKQFKIGKTSGDPQNRVNQITRGASQLLPNPLNAKLVVSLAMDTNPYYLEQLLHMRLWQQHIGGEWFEFEGAESLATLIKDIESFGVITYYDRWYKYFDHGFLANIIADIYPVGLDYNRSVKVYAYNSKFHVSLKDNQNEELNRVVRQYKREKAQYPEHFGHVIVEVDFRTAEQRKKEDSDMFTSLFDQKPDAK